MMKTTWSVWIHGDQSSPGKNYKLFSVVARIWWMLVICHTLAISQNDTSQNDSSLHSFVWAFTHYVVHVGRTKRLSQSAKLVTHIPVSRWSRIRRTSLLTQVCRCTTVTGPGFQQQAENELEQHPTHYLANASANRLVEFWQKLACGLFNSIQVLDLDHHEAWITFVHVDNMAEFKTFPETKFTKWLRSQNSYWRRR